MKSILTGSFSMSNDIMQFIVPHHSETYPLHQSQNHRYLLGHLSH
jgi:enterochelin esterase-like enzyme